MLGIVLTLFFAIDILLAVLSARSEPGARIRTVALVFFVSQLVVGVGGGFYAVLRSFI